MSDNANLTVRRLGADDWRQMGRLRATRSNHGGAHVSAFSSNPLSSVATHYQHLPMLAVGAFSGQQLEAYICAYHDALAEDEHGEPFWTLDLMISNGDPDRLRACLQACLEHYEQQGVNQFYYAFPEKWARAYRSFWKAGTPSLRKYVIEDICVIQPRQRPQSQFIWEHVLHEYIVPVPFLLRRSYVQTAS